jgi:hypothetical protein
MNTVTFTEDGPVVTEDPDVPKLPDAVVGWLSILGLRMGDNIEVNHLGGGSTFGHLANIVIGPGAIPVALCVTSRYNGALVTCPWTSIASLQAVTAR